MIESQDYPPSRKKTPKVDTSATPREKDALAALINRLARWEETNPVYREMCAAVDARVTARAAPTLT